MFETKKKILGVIPARGGSKGVSKKNIRIIAGKPLIAYSIELAKKLAFLYKTLVSTDSKEIAEIAKAHGAQMPFLRPKELAEDETPMLPVLQHAVNFIENIDKVKIDYLLLLQPVNPLRSIEDVEGCVKKIIESGADSVISVSKVDSLHPVLMKKIEDDLIKPYCLDEIEGTRRQDFKPDAYMRSGGIYITKRDVLMRENSIWGKISRPYIIPKKRGIGIDDEIDLLIVEQLLLRRKHEIQNS